MIKAVKKIIIYNLLPNNLINMTDLCDTKIVNYTTYYRKLDERFKIFLGLSYQLKTVRVSVI